MVLVNDFNIILDDAVTTELGFSSTYTAAIVELVSRKAAGALERWPLGNS